MQLLLILLLLFVEFGFVIVRLNTQVLHGLVLSVDRLKGAAQDFVQVELAAAHGADFASGALGVRFVIVAGARR